MKIKYDLKYKWCNWKKCNCFSSLDSKHTIYWQINTDCLNVISKGFRMSDITEEILIISCNIIGPGHYSSDGICIIRLAYGCLCYTISDGSIVYSHSHRWSRISTGAHACKLIRWPKYDRGRSRKSWFIWYS